MMTKAEKVRENQLRRAANRQGFTLSRFRRRDPLGRDYGKYLILDMDTGDQVASRLTLDEVETWVKNPSQR
jgi:hypothetical protein